MLHDILCVMCDALQGAHSTQNRHCDGEIMHVRVLSVCVSAVNLSVYVCVYAFKRVCMCACTCKCVGFRRKCIIYSCMHCGKCEFIVRS